MNNYVNERTLDEAKYIISSNATVRDTAKVFGVSKSTVFNDVTKRLPKLSNEAASKVRKILEINKEERSIRGGRALALRYIRGNQQ